uniref:CC_3452 family protein n=1 Tax=Parerythrobacter lutipelagi TaxID=1964208 RepID=UPI0010F44131|nr:hypothetical protein [Parerythrobacter lutipelagi]
MTLSNTLPRIVPAAVLALGWTALSFGALTATPAEARGNQPHYTVELAQPAKETRAIAGGVAWSCAGTTCVAAKGTSRPVIMCTRLQREVGPIASFTTDGKALKEDKLVRCNEQ